MKVAVLKGGGSLERQVSLRSGARVEYALETLGHRVAAIDVGPTLINDLREADPDVAFVALHGPGGEDGTIQELLELLGIPYTSPRPAACMRCLDKVLAKHELRAAGVATPDSVTLSATAIHELGAALALSEVEERLGFPLVVKPATQGSALGISFAASREDVPRALLAGLSYDDRVLLERHVEGRELAVGILDGAVLPPVEVIPEGDRYDYASRYDIGASTYVCPAPLADDELAAIENAARTIWSTFGLSGFSRVDMLLGDNGPEVIEVEAIPGLTDTSLFPLAADAAGLPFEDLCARILEIATAHA